MGKYIDPETGRELASPKSTASASNMIYSQLERLRSLRTMFSDFTQAANQKADSLIGHHGPCYGEKECDPCGDDQDSVPPLVECAELIDQLERIAGQLGEAIDRF